MTNELRQCVECEEDFIARRYNAKVCSEKCRKLRATGIHRGNCVICGIEFRVTEFKKDTKRFCSQKCRGASPELREVSRQTMIKFWQENPGHFTGEKSPSWEGGKVEAKDKRLLTKEWKEIREKVLELHEHKCQECGGDDRLNIHHKIPWSLDNDKSDDIDNLTVLCKTCHCKHHSKERYREYGGLSKKGESK